jgi:hypothetical protein
MMENLDLDIHNYTIKDIERFFRFRSNTVYTEEDIELREYEIREQLLKSGQIHKRLKRDLLSFLETAKQWLIVVKCKSSETKKTPTVIPKNYKLDTFPAPASLVPPARTDELIQRPQKQFVYSNNSDFFPGTLNPLDTRVLTKYVNIDTRFRENFSTESSSDFTVHLPVKLNKVVSMQLSSLEFPITFNNTSVDLGNNYFYLQLHYTDLSQNEVSAEEVFILPDGNYTSIDFISVINSLLSPTNPGGSLQYPNRPFSYIQFSLNITTNGSGTGKVTLAATAGFPGILQSITLDFTKNIHMQKDSSPISSKIGWNLGFIKPIYRGALSYTGDTVVEASTIRYLYLAIDDYQHSSNNNFISIFSKSVLNPNIFARISLKGAYFTLIMENDFTIVSEPRKYFGPVDIQKLRIRIYDDHGRILNMNNSNFSFCLDFKMLYDL